MRKALRSSLRLKLIAPFVVGTLTLTLLLASYTYLSARKTVEDTTLLISEAKTNYTIDNVNVFFENIGEALHNMVVYPQIVNVFKNAHTKNKTENSSQEPLAESVEQVEHDENNPLQVASAWMQEIASANNYYKDILLLNRQGVCIVASNESYLNKSYAQEDYVQKALKGEFNFADYSIGRKKKELSVLSAGPVRANGEVAGVLIVVNASAKLVDYEQKIDFDPKLLTTSILAGNGVFMAHKDPMLMGNSELTYSRLYKQLQADGGKGQAIAYILGGQKYVGYAELEPQTKWLFITSGLESEVYAPAYKMGFFVFIISLTFLAVVSFVVIRVANGILSGLLSLIQYAKQVADGDLNQELGQSNRIDELGTLHVTLRRLVSALRQMLEETRAANKIKDEFIANMSHEMRTPLNAIIGTAHLSLREGDLAPKQVNFLNRIQLAAKSLLGLINNILDISTAEAGKLALENIPFDLREVILNTVAIQDQNATSKGLELKAEYVKGTPHFFVGDPFQISQIVNNLIVNAIKFTSQGSVQLRCWQDENFAEDQRAKIYISVRDTGVGIAPEVLPNLFKPFVQADGSTTRKYGGSGLGLAVSKRLVQAMGGEFSVESSLNLGSTFTFYINLALANNEPDEIEVDDSTVVVSEELDLEGRSILLAEDNEINQMIVEEFLEPTKALITKAENGQKAVDAITDKSFDLVLMDMQMPVMGGLEATRIIRTLPNGKDVPIIAVTANAREEDKQNAFSSGMNDFLSKPIDPEQMFALLRKWIVSKKN